MKTERLANQVIWISGASSGIGKALALRLAKEGARVALTARRSQVLDQIREEQPAQIRERLLSLPADVLEPKALESAYGKLKSEWGLPDVVIANAGTHVHMEAQDLDAEKCRQVVAVNLDGAINLLLLAAPDFIERRRGRLVGVASLAGYRGLPAAAAYGASKAGLINFLESLRFDLEPFDVGVTIVNPGFVKTPLTDKNPFEMPFLIEVEQAVDAIVDGLAEGKREIHFPWQFSWIMKTLRVLPFPLYHRLVGRLTKKGG